VRELERALNTGGEFEIGNRPLVIPNNADRILKIDFMAELSKLMINKMVQDFFNF
jgi:hypothetical protein